MKRILLVILCSLLVLPTAGCWSKRELEQLAVVTLAGYDKETVNGHDRFRVTARVLKPSGNRGSTETKGSSTEVLLTGTGDTIQETAREVTLRTPRRPYFGQLAAIIVGENLARQGVGQIIELLGRWPEIGLRTKILVAKGDAYDVLNSAPEIEPTLSQEIAEMADAKNVKLGISCGVDLNQFFQALMSDDIAPVAGSIECACSSGESSAGANGSAGANNLPGQTDQRVNMQGMAIFHKDKLAGTISPQETTGYLLLRNKFQNSETPITFRADKQKFFTYLLRNSKCDIIPEINDGSVHFRVNIETQGDLDEVSEVNVTPESLQMLENQAAERVKAIVERTIAKAQSLDSDFIGFAYRLHRRDPAAWAEWKSQWDEMFPDVTYDVSVSSTISNVGKMSKNIILNY